MSTMAESRSPVPIRGRRKGLRVIVPGRRLLEDGDLASPGAFQKRSKDSVSSAQLHNRVEPGGSRRGRSQ